MTTTTTYNPNFHSNTHHASPFSHHHDWYSPSKKTPTNTFRVLSSLLSVVVVVLQCHNSSGGGGEAGEGPFPTITSSSFLFCEGFTALDRLRPSFDTMSGRRRRRVVHRNSRAFGLPNKRVSPTTLSFPLMATSSSSSSSSSSSPACPEDEKDEKEASSSSILDGDSTGKKEETEQTAEKNTNATAATAQHNHKPPPPIDPLPPHHPLQSPAGLLSPPHPDSPPRRRKRVLVLCTGGTLTMSTDPTTQGHNSLVPIQGALTAYMSSMKELTDDPAMPQITSHEYTPLIDSSDMGPGDWTVLARDITTNYYHFDGFVVLMGTDTMAYAASALSFMFQNLGKPVVFTGSQIPLVEPYNDARKNLIMACIFASSDTVSSEVTIFFHDRLLRGCRSTKVNTSKLHAFDSPNMDPLAEIGIHIEENGYLFRPPPRGAFRVRTEMDTRLITLRLVPGFDDSMIQHMIRAARETHLKGLILQLYGTGNLPSVKNDMIHCLKEAVEAGVCVVAMTQCQTGSVIMGHYATGRALKEVGVVSAGDMTLEATIAKLAYLLGRQDLSIEEVRDLMGVDLRGELTPENEMSPPPLASAYQKAIAKKNRGYVF